MPPGTASSAESEFYAQAARRLQMVSGSRGVGCLRVALLWFEHVLVLVEALLGKAVVPISVVGVGGNGCIVDWCAAVAVRLLPKQSWQKHSRRAPKQYSVKQ